MSLYQCKQCGCMENTACGKYWGHKKKICSACAPKEDYGQWSQFGEWHGRFERKYFAKGMYITNSDGNLEHRETGELATLTNGHNKELN